MASAEQPRKLLLEAGIHPVEGILEARARFAVDLPHRRFESLERVGQILALPVQILLALGLLFELADRREIHLAQALDLSLHLLDLRFPARYRGLRGTRGQKRGACRARAAAHPAHRWRFSRRAAHPRPAREPEALLPAALASRRAALR